MPTFAKRLSIATAFALGIALSTPLSVPAFSDPVPSAMPTSFQLGERVRMRYWDGVPISESFPADVLQKF